MGIKIKEDHVLTKRLGARYGLEDTDVFEKWELAKGVFPITQADEVLKTVKISSTAVSATSGGWKTGPAVPSGKKWYVLGYDLNRTTGSTATISAFGVNDGVAKVRLDSVTAAVLVVGSFGQQILMEEGWSFDIYCAAGGGADVVTVNLLYIEEDAF